MIPGTCTGADAAARRVRRQQSDSDPQYTGPGGFGDDRCDRRCRLRRPVATATAVPATPTPLAATSTALVATGTALSATSSAFVSTASTGLCACIVLPVSSAVSDPQAQAIVDKARARFDQVNALHFTLTVDGDVYLDTLHTQKLKSADGDLIRPDKVSLTAKASVGPVNATLKFIQIGDQAYLTNILTGKVGQSPCRVRL